jgi:hypothetical protein
MPYSSVSKHNGNCNDFNACFVKCVPILKYYEDRLFLQFTIHTFRDAHRNYDESR